MSVELVLALFVLAALVIYALTGGADYGGGLWDLLATGPRAQRQREVIEHAIAPIWEANHVWLILVVVVLFTAFPPAFAVMMTALHVPITLVLLGVVLRGSTFAFRKYDPGGHRRWGTIFGVASLATPLFLGITLGGLASGEVRVADGRVTTGFFAGWTRPFALACGASALGLFAFLAAVYLTVDAEGESDVQEDFRRRALVSGVAVALLWGWVLNPEYGIVNMGLKLIGIQGPRWFASEEWAVPAMVMVAVWGTGTNMVLYLAGLQSIPTSLYEAAAIDGANAWQRFWRITFPLLRPVSAITLLLGLVYTLKVFDIIWIMTKGGPADSSTTFATWSYQLGFGNLVPAFGPGAAVGNLLVVAALVFGLIYVRVQRKQALS